MSTTDPLSPQHMADQYGLAVAARLTAGTAELPYEVRERLRAARVRALERRKEIVLASAPVIAGRGAAGSLALGGGDLGFWGRLGSALPLLALVAGLMLIHTVQNDSRASEVAEIDQALLTDDLPPSAYADPGFVQFLKTNRD